MFVKPVEGRTVRRPDTLVYLRAEGEEVPDGDMFWTRRLRDGDVKVVEPATAEVEELEPTEHEETEK